MTTSLKKKSKNREKKQIYMNKSDYAYNVEYTTGYICTQIYIYSNYKVILAIANFYVIQYILFL